MAWVKFEPRCNGFGKRIPAGFISVDRTRRAITFGAATARSWGLAQFDSADVFVDDERSVLVAVRFKAGKGNDYCLHVVGSCRQVRCTALLRVLGVQPGRYQARKLSPGFVVIDFSNSVEEGR